MNNTDMMSWDDDITVDGSSFTLLLPGTYEGVITKVEKKREDRPGKMYDYPYAEVTITINDNGQKGTVKNKLYLSKKMEFKFANLFESLGLKKKGETVKAFLIDKIQGKNVKVVVTCDYKNSYTNTYQSLDKEQVENALKEGVKVFNNVQRYEPSDKQNTEDDFSFDQFGYAG